MSPLKNGKLSSVPSTGIRRKKFITTGKKPLNSTTKPYTSMHIPTSGNPNKTVKIPPKKAPDPFHLCRWKKNEKLRSNPTTNPTPAKNSIFPIAKRPLSKKSKTPKNMKVIPKAAKPTPIFCVSVIWII